MELPIRVYIHICVCVREREKANNIMVPGCLQVRGNRGLYFPKRFAVVKNILTGQSMLQSLSLESRKLVQSFLVNITRLTYVITDEERRIREISEIGFTNGQFFQTISRRNHKLPPA